MGIPKTNSFKPLGPHASHGTITWVVFNMQLSDFIHRCRTVRERYLYCLENFVVNFRRDLLWYGDVRPSIRHSFPHFSPTCFDILSWNFVYDFILMHLQIKIECCWFVSIFVGVMSLLELRKLEIHNFPHYSHTCFDILSWNFVYDFPLMN